MPRNTQTRVVFADEGKRFNVEGAAKNDSQIRLQSGTNAFDSQKVSGGSGGGGEVVLLCWVNSHALKPKYNPHSLQGMTGFGMPRDVKGKHMKRIWELE